ncbi:hypothetical protein BTA51_09300 [Hahella sp. CCB-MM4]|uniref:hypothetical protein n=1 Tax=Hahella sp. (strain CCB-MM4) TaxID=1926491 RepID=UPI000BCE5B06|nr:hypothetical protein [Hahella sp. CCB-MM4]OZG73965.1 hypothetical protein BTA51_09300 [Hahella sp. CCB-MM4]
MKSLVKMAAFTLVLTLYCVISAAASLEANGKAVVLQRGNQVSAETLKSPMLLLISNVSSALAGFEVKYSFAFGGDSSIRTLPIGDPTPQLWPNNWNGAAITVTNLSISDEASLQLNFYGITTPPNLPLKDDFSPIPLAQYQTAGGNIAASSAYLQLNAPFEEAIFVVLIGNELITYTVNGEAEFDNNTNIKMTKNNSIDLSLNDKLGKSLLIVNASKTPTTQANVSYRQLVGN